MAKQTYGEWMRSNPPIPNITDNTISTETFKYNQWMSDEDVKSHFVFDSSSGISTALKIRDKAQVIIDALESRINELNKKIKVLEDYNYELQIIDNWNKK
jgi:hypothetical protein